MDKTFGIDISSWQGDIDLAKLKPDFVIIRVGFGNSIDNKAIRNMDLCERLGIPYGVYWYSYALSVEAAKKEAATCLALISGHPVSVGVWFDMEDADGYKARNGALRKDLTSAISYAFAETIEDAGYYSGIYTSLSWLRDGYVDGCERFDKWIACWGSNSGELTTDTSQYGTMHQYAGDINKDGYNIDLNVCYVPLSTYSVGSENPTYSGTPNNSPGTNQQPQEEPDAPAVGEPVTSGYLIEVPLLTIGDKGGYVRAAQTLLIARGYDCGNRPLIGTEKADGDFGRATERAVAFFQSAQGLEVDGEIGCDTWTALLKNF